MAQEFFNEAREQSAVKTAIVTKYFDSWARVILPWAEKRDGRIAYLDLFSGPGRFQDGTLSTPLLILQKAIADDRLANSLVTLFNDASNEFSSNLKAEIAKLDSIERLEYPPEVRCDDVGDQFVSEFERMKLIPTLFFVDPWGYKGLSLRLVNSVLKDWGCDCIFFFNYNRINMGLSNPIVESHMNSLFGQEPADELRTRISQLPPEDRELAVVEALAEALNPQGNRYVLPFRFRLPDGSRTSHHLIFVSKNIRGYSIMKEVMHRESSWRDQGVASFEYNRAYRDQGLLFELSAPLDDLQEMLCADFGGQTMTMKEVFDRHHVGKPFISKNYKDALKALEAAGRIQADPPANERRKNSFADRVKVTFP